MNVCAVLSLYSALCLASRQWPAYFSRSTAACNWLNSSSSSGCYYSRSTGLSRCPSSEEKHKPWNRLDLTHLTQRLGKEDAKTRASLEKKLRREGNKWGGEEGKVWKHIRNLTRMHVQPSWSGNKWGGEEEKVWKYICNLTRECACSRADQEINERMRRRMCGDIFVTSRAP